MSSARAPSSHKMNKVTNTPPAKGSGASFCTLTSHPRLPSERLNSQCSEYLGSTTSALFQAPEIRLPRTISNSMHDRGSIKSSSSLPPQPRTSSDEWKVGMAPKPLPKTFYESDRKVSAESQRPARQGWEWVWVLEDNWVKRESSVPLEVPNEKLTSKRLRRSLPVRKTGGVYKSNSQGSSSSSRGEYAAKSSISDVANTHDRTTSRPSTLPRGDRSKSVTWQTSNKLFRGFQYMSPTYPHFRSPAGEPEGLYCKTKRGIGVGLVGKSKEDVTKLILRSEEELPSRVRATLKGATSALGGSQKDATQPSMLFPEGRPPSMISQRPSRRIGIAPWHRRNSQDSTWSVSSSIRDILRGKTPVSTPNPEMQYGGHQGKKYAKDITRKEEPTFLPSEAMQVHTPPASTGTASSISRGFFLDLSPSVNDQKPGVALADRTLVSPAASQTAMKAQITSRGKREWWDDIETILDSDAPVFRAQIELLTRGQIEPLIRGQVESSNLEWNTPEHLPNSPLCPLFRKERHSDSGGYNDICVYHGRK